MEPTDYQACRALMRMLTSGQRRLMASAAIAEEQSSRNPETEMARAYLVFAMNRALNAVDAAWDSETGA